MDGVDGMDGMDGGEIVGWEAGGRVGTMDGKPHLAGVIVGMQRQTDRTVSPFEERTVHTPLGLAIAVQAEVVADVIRGL
jgi:hypothetical protein